jgi:hypothetical protein
MNGLSGSIRQRDSPSGPKLTGVDLTPERGDLMARDQGFGGLGAVGPGEQSESAEYPQHRQISAP